MIDTPLQSEPVAVPERPSGGATARAVVAWSIVTGFMLVAPVIVFLPAALLYCGVRHGKRAAWIAFPVGVVIAALLMPALTSVNAHDYVGLAMYVLAIAVPTMVVLPMVERGEPFGRVLLYALTCSFAGMLLTESASRALTGFSPYGEQLAAAQDNAAKLIKMYTDAGIPASFAKTVMNFGVFCVTGFVLVDIAAIFVISLVIFGRIRAWRDMTERRPVVLAAPYLFRNLALPEWLLFGFVIGGLSPLVHGFPQKIGANLLTVVIFLYLVQGLAIFRSLLVTLGASLGMTLFAYGMLVLLTFAGGIAPLLLGIAGLFDPFFDFRHFTKRKDDSDESHFD